MLIFKKKANFTSFWILPLANMVPAYHSLAGRPHCAPFNKFKNILVLTATTRSASEGEERVRDKEGAPPPPPPFTASRRVRRTALSLQDLGRCSLTTLSGISIAFSSLRECTGLITHHGMHLLTSRILSRT